MAQHNKTCAHCGTLGHSKSYCPTRPRTPIKRVLDKPKPKKAVVKKPTPKASKTALKKKLEVLVKDYVKRRDDYICQYCSKYVTGADCHASHVIPVSRSGYLQFDPINMKVLCRFHHLYWWHKHPVEAGKWFTDTFPERWEYLSELHKQRLKPMSEIELQEMIDYYSSKVAQLQKSKR